MKSMEPQTALVASGEELAQPYKDTWSSKADAVEGETS